MKKILFLILVAATCLSSCKKEEDMTIYKIDYTINCSKCDVAYVSDQAGTQTHAMKKNRDWTYSFNAKKGQEIMLSASNTSNEAQPVTTTIKLNGEILTTKTSYTPVSGITSSVEKLK